MAPDRTYFVTASKDKSAKVNIEPWGVSKEFPRLTQLPPKTQIMDVDNLKVLKTFVTDTPLNTAALTPKKDFVILGGGQEARDVTTTSQRQGKFEARFYHKIFEDEIGRVRGHFGPLNTV